MFEKIWMRWVRFMIRWERLIEAPALRERWTAKGQRDLREGLRQSAAGETVYLGSFAEYVEAQDDTRG